MDDQELSSKDKQTKKMQKLKWKVKILSRTREASIKCIHTNEEKKKITHININRKNKLISG